MSEILCPRCGAPLVIYTIGTRSGSMFAVSRVRCNAGEGTSAACGYGNDALRTLVPQPDPIKAAEPVPASVRPGLSAGAHAYLTRLLDREEASAALHANVIDREDDAKRRSAFYREGNAQAVRAELESLRQ